MTERKAIEKRKALEISRRNFLIGGSVMAAGMLLPIIPGTLGSFLVSFQPDTACAAETPTFSIMVVGRKQMGIAVGDTGTYDPQTKTINAISSAKVTLHSFYNNQEVSGTTDETGKMVLSIDGLCSDHPAEVEESVDSEGKQLDYRFFGSLTVARDGYRDVVVPYAHLMFNFSPTGYQAQKRQHLFCRCQCGNLYHRCAPSPRQKNGRQLRRLGL